MAKKTTQIKELLDWTKNTKYRTVFTRLSSKINAKNLDKAIQTQTKNKVKRTLNNNTEDNDKE